MPQRRSRGWRAVEFWGGVLWLASLQFFLVQAVVQLAWPVPYDPVRASISDLGRLSCTPTECSPLHVLMNASFVVLGLTMAAGAIAAELSSPRASTASRVAAGLLVLAGAGVVGVGLVPNDTIVWLHTTTAAVAITGGNTGTALTGWVLARLRRMTVVGALGIAAGLLGWAFTLILGAAHLGASALLPIGGLLERGAVYPTLFALIVSGGALVRGDWIDRLPSPVPRSPR